jgi:hypothetical protein
LSELLKNKKIFYILSGILIVILFSVFAIKEISDGKKQIEALKEQQKEILILKNEFLSLKQKIDAIESKKNLSNVQGIIEAIEEIFSSIGLKDKVKTIKSTVRREIKDGIEEEADIYIEKVSMNEMVNIFHRVENAPMILTIKKATIKKSFENPERLNISLTLSFLKSK